MLRSRCGWSLCPLGPSKDPRKYSENLSHIWRPPHHPPHVACIRAARDKVTHRLSRAVSWVSTLQLMPPIHTEANGDEDDTEPEEEPSQPSIKLEAGDQRRRMPSRSVPPCRRAETAQPRTPCPPTYAKSRRGPLQARGRRVLAHPPRPRLTQPRCRLRPRRPSPRGSACGSAASALYQSKIDENGDTIVKNLEKIGNILARFHDGITPIPWASMRGVN